MTVLLKKIVLFHWLMLLLPSLSLAAVKTPLLITYDSSNSMWGELQDSSRKYQAGRTALTDLLDSNLNEREIAFRAYGHRHKTDCRDTELLVPFTDLATARNKIREAVGALRPTGKTPITHSLRQGLADFAGRGGDILLISDGIETCDIDPCELMRQWQESGVKIRVHVVGVGLTESERGAMACIADTTGGRYLDAGSAKEFTAALAGVSEAIEQPKRDKSADTESGYVLRIKAVDDQGKSYVAKGTLQMANEEPLTVRSHRRNTLASPGEYRLEVGPVLSDGTIFEPVTQTVAITEVGETDVQVRVKRPAIVLAQFKENGKEHQGSTVTAYVDVDGRKTEAFRFRAFDEALARPGTYEFRATPNADNTLSLTQALVAGQTTQLQFALDTTVGFYVRYLLPDGQTLRRSSELWRDGEKRYSVFAANPTRVRPGKYELRSPDQNLPLTPVEIEVRQDGETIDVPLDAGWVVIEYQPSLQDYVGEPDRAFIESLDRGDSKYARVNSPIPVAPGRYRANPQTNRGFMEPVDLLVGNNETVTATFKPKPLGEIVVNFEPSEHYEKLPDRASVYALDGQEILSGFMRPGRAKKFLPGRYRVDPRRADTPPVEIEVRAHEQTTVLLKYKAP